MAKVDTMAGAGRGGARRYSAEITWTPELKERVRSMVAEGLSARAIAARMPFKCTRNSIVGIVMRNKLGSLHGHKLPLTKSIAITAKKRKDINGKSKTLVEAARAFRGDVPQPAPKPLPPPVPVNVEPLHIPLMELSERTCKWPTIGEREHQLFCGVPKPITGPAYCPAHAARMHYPRERKTDGKATQTSSQPA